MSKPYYRLDPYAKPRGDGEGWYGTPGEHYGPDDPPGRQGPYDSNGGFCHCH